MEKNVQMVRERLERRTHALLRTDYDRCQSDLAILLNFIYKTPILRNIIETEQLGGYHLSFLGWEDRLRDKGPDFPHEERARAAMCLAVLEHYARAGDPWQVMSSMGTGETNVDMLTREFMEYFALPLYEYLEEQLQMRQAMITSEDIMKESQALVDGRIGRHYPEAQRGIQQAYEDLFAADTPEACQNVARTCRQALISFANETYHPEFLPASVSEPPADDVKSKLKYTVRNILGGSAEDRYSRSWESLIQSSWDLVTAVSHLKSASQEDAKICVIYTYLTISQVGRLLQDRSRR